MPTREELLREEASTLWRVGGFGRERHAPASKYWFENPGRDGRSAIFQYNVSGLIVFRDQQRRMHEVRPGHALLFLHDEDTAYGLPRGATEPFVTEFVALSGAGVREHWELLRRQGSILRVDPEGPVLAAMRRLMEVSRSSARFDAAAMSAEAHAFVMLLVTSQRQELASAQSPVERAVDDLLRAPTAPWSLKQVAERHGVSREHLTRTFHQRLGLSPAAWLAKARLGKALSLLRETTLPVAEVARQSGYASTHTLARQVRAETGKSPRAARRSAR
jgi:AraC family transcriptional activator FtrA